MMGGNKQCSKCRELKSLSEFYFHRRDNKYSYHCKKCVKIRCAQRYRLFYRHDSEKIRTNTLKVKYGITYNDYEEIFNLQNGVCAICGKPELTKYKGGQIQRLSIDHCHKTKEVRGLLCRKCNTALSAFDDDIDVLASAISYLINSKIKVVA